MHTAAAARRWKTYESVMYCNINCPCDPDPKKLNSTPSPIKYNRESKSGSTKFILAFSIWKTCESPVASFSKASRWPTKILTARTPSTTLTTNPGWRGNGRKRTTVIANDICKNMDINSRMLPNCSSKFVPYASSRTPNIRRSSGFTSYPTMYTAKRAVASVDKAKGANCQNMRNRRVDTPYPKYKLVRAFCTPSCSSNVAKNSDTQSKGQAQASRRQKPSITREPRRGDNVDENIPPQAISGSSPCPSRAAVNPSAPSPNPFKTKQDVE
mmetsp:Transcript_95258/g.254745  ORF Transcript_95258/g.254745 Transcript_95258/m.254745 type:complete len:270 (-) Transcript_95258:166-975(-)